MGDQDFAARTGTRILHIISTVLNNVYSEFEILYLEGTMER